MIISISGKAGSGKDTVGSIIQYLTAQLSKGNPMSYDKWLSHQYRAASYTWQIKKYSDKLKDIVCILIGCTREQLEDQEFKETPLGKEWTKWGIVRPNGTRVIDIQSSYEKAFERKETVWQDGSTIKEIQLTPRMILQLIGTEGSRDLIHPDIWVNALYAEYQLCDAETFGGYGYLNCGCNLEEGSLGCKKPTSNWIITDSRFPNDVRRTREMGGVLVRVNRAECEGRKNEHISETALDDCDEWDYVIENNGTIEELIEQVRTILEEEGIIKEKES